MKLAELTRLREPGGVNEVRDVPPLRARLEDAAGSFDHVGQLSGKLDRDRAWFLAVDVFARLGGVDRSDGVPAVACSDEHGVDIITLEQLAEIAKRVAPVVAVLLIGHRFDGFTAIGSHVGNRGEADVGLIQEEAEHVSAPVANADPAKHNPLAG